MKQNEKQLPFLDKALLDEIFSHVFDQKFQEDVDEPKLAFINLLLTMQAFNFSYRQDACIELAPIMEETIGPFITNSDGPLFYFALGLAIKELYGMRSSTFRSVMRLITKENLL